MKTSKNARWMVLALLVLVAAGTTKAGVITSYTAGTSSNGALDAYGESFTLGSGGPWNHITFNFFTFDPNTNPFAIGTLYVLSSEYLGTPAGLSSATPGFLGASTGISGGIYQFNPSLTLQPNTTYFFYEDTLLPTLASASGGNAGIPGKTYFSTGTGVNFSVLTSHAIINFELDGTQVPEPGTFLLSLGGLAMFAVIRRISVSDNPTCRLK